MATFFELLQLIRFTKKIWGWGKGVRGEAEWRWGLGGGGGVVGGEEGTRWLEGGIVVERDIEIFLATWTRFLFHVLVRIAY